MSCSFRHVVVVYVREVVGGSTLRVRGCVGDGEVAFAERGPMPCNPLSWIRVVESWCLSA